MVGNTEAEHWSVITKLFIWFLNHVFRAEKKRGEEYLWDHIEPNLRIRLDCAVLGQDRWCVVWDKTCGSRRPGSAEYSCVCALRMFISQENGLHSHSFWWSWQMCHTPALVRFNWQLHRGSPSARCSVFVDDCAWSLGGAADPTGGELFVNVRQTLCLTFLTSDAISRPPVNDSCHWRCCLCPHRISIHFFSVVFVSFPSSISLEASASLRLSGSFL